MGDRQQQYPAMLARELLKAGYDNVEVRNRIEYRTEEDQRRKKYYLVCTRVLHIL